MGRRLTISKSKKRVLIGIAATLAIAAALTGGWIWWTRPALRSAPLPDESQSDQVRAQGGSTPDILTTVGAISSAGLRSEDHEWVARLRWTDLESLEHIYELRLGEPVDIEGLGVVTLVGVDPAPLIDPNKFSWLPGIEEKVGGGEWIYFVVQFKDGVRYCGRAEDYCP
ncbi:hypothetical protein [Actinomyces qiguomingii]|nr:hypothetical protein [Actinomyces qiguomingii]